MLVQQYNRSLTKKDVEEYKEAVPRHLTGKKHRESQKQGIIPCPNAQVHNG
jgi:hypothetical protein